MVAEHKVEWIKLLSEVVQEMPNVRFIANNPYEIWYAHSVQNATYINFQTIRPTGHWPNNSRLAFAAGDPEANVVVPQPHVPYLNDILISNLTTMGVPFVTLEHGRYGGAARLAQYRCVILIPYQVSVMSMYENLAAGVVMLVPSLSFYRSFAPALVQHGVGIFLEDLDALENDPLGWAATEWWGPYFADILVHFDSWEHLKQLLSGSGEFEFQHHKQVTKEFMTLHTRYALSQWSDLLWCRCDCEENVTET